MELTTTISRFQYEDMCCLGYNTLPLSSVCNAKCMFCSNKMNPFKLARCGFRPIHEVKQFLFNNAKRILPGDTLYLSDVLPGRMSEGEATLHPHFFDICWLIRRAHPNLRLHISTNGSRLTKEFVAELERLKPFEVMLSYHSTDVKLWTDIFGLSEKEFEVATNAWSLLTDAGIGVCGAIVAMPNMQGYEDIEKTMKFFNSFSPLAVHFWEPGYSQFADDDLVELMRIDDKQKYTDFVYRMYDECNNTIIYWNKDPYKPIDIDTFPHMVHSVRVKKENVMWLTGEASYDRLVEKIKYDSQYVGNNHYVQQVVNHTYGGNINCNGLLMMKDMRLAIGEASVSPDLIVAPSVMLDNLGNDLVGDSYTELTKIPTWWRIR